MITPLNGCKESWQRNGGRYITTKDTSVLNDMLLLFCFSKNTDGSPQQFSGKYGHQTPMTCPDIHIVFRSNLQGCSRKFISEDFHTDTYLQVKTMLWFAQAAVGRLQGVTEMIWELGKAAEPAPVFLQNINQLAFHSFNSTSLTNSYTQWFPHFPKMYPLSLSKWFTQLCPSIADFGSLLYISTTSCVQKFCLTCFLAVAFYKSSTCSLF